MGSTTDWFNKPITSWIMVLIGIVLLIYSVYGALSSFYVNLINPYTTPVILQFASMVLVMMIGCICVYLGVKGYRKSN